MQQLEKVGLSYLRKKLISITYYFTNNFTT